MSRKKKHDHPSRRDVFHLAALAGMSLAARRAFGFTDSQPPPVKYDGRCIVFIELNGGNDALNTIIPVADPRYYELRQYDSSSNRANIAVRESVALPLDGLAGTALDGYYRIHPNLPSLRAMFNDGDAAVVTGVGYPGNSRSHFTGARNWSRGNDTQSLHSDGWMARTVAATPLESRQAWLIDGISPNGFLFSYDKLVRSVKARSGESLYRYKGRPRLAPKLPEYPDNPAAAAVITAHDNGVDVADMVENLMYSGASGDPQYDPPDVDYVDWGDDGGDLRAVAQMIISGIPCPMYGIYHGSYDQHGNIGEEGLGGAHGDRLTELNQMLFAFQKVIKDAGLWDRVLIVTHSEFGRRVVPNSGGTDHGGGGTHFMIGGAVNGGFYDCDPTAADIYTAATVKNAVQIDLSHDNLQLHRRDQPSTVHFRRYFSTAASWLELDAKDAFDGGVAVPLAGIVPSTLPGL